MRPVHELLHRIRWDADFGRGDFQIVFYDRVEDREITVAFRDLQFFPDDHFAVGFVDADGQPHTVPLHRIRAVYKDGKLIWERR